jgi:PGF-pre-PGF domain-containing protein
MTKYTHLALLCTVVVLGLLISPVMAIEAAPGEHIYRGFDRAQDRPDIDGDRIVWQDDRNGNNDIYLGTVGDFRRSLGSYTGERITTDPASQAMPSISGNYIVWQDSRNGNSDIYLYDISTREERPLTNDSGYQWLPIVRGNYAAWYDNSTGKTNIVLYDIGAGAVKAVIEANAKTTIPFSTVGTEFRPALSERYLAWVNESDSGERLWYYDIEAGSVVGRVSTTATSPLYQSWPSLSGSLIAWEDYRHGTTNPEIYMADLDNPAATERRITTAPGYQVSPTISERLIAWEDMRDGPRAIYMYDLSSDGEEMIAFEPAGPDDEQLYPVASGNTIVWQRGQSPNSNLYMFVYEPKAPTEPVLTTINVTPKTITLNVNDTITFNATALDQNGQPMTVSEINWTSSNETVGTIDTSGVFTALAVGTTEITATSGNVSGTANVTVSEDAPTEPVATSITISPSTVTLAINETERFNATVLDQRGREMTNVTVTWTSSNTTVGSIDADGIFTALAVGTTEITASVDNVSGTASVTVSEDIPAEPVPTSITISPPTATLAINETERFNATVLDQRGREMINVTVTWTSSNTTVGSIDADGIFTALAAGTTNVTASAGNISAEATVTVNDSEVEPIATEIRITPPRATLAVNDTQRFMATIFDQDGQPMSVSEINWTSSNETVGSIDTNGIFTALAAGTTNVTASAGNISAEATITVNADEPVLARLVIQPSAVTLNVGDDLLFEVSGFDRSGNVVSDVAVTWASSDETVGTIDEFGTFIALAVGTTNVTVTADNVSGTATVTVNDGEEEPIATTLAITPAAITLNVNDTAVFAANALDQNGRPITVGSINWTSSDETVGTIDAGGIFTARAAGRTTITASGQNITGTVDVRVTNESSGVVVTPSEITVYAGDTRRFTAIPYDSEGSVVSGEVTWSSDDPSVGEIGSDGVFSALREGTTTITASVEGLNETGAATVTVLPAPMALTQITVSPSGFTIAANNTLALTVRDESGSVIPAGNLTWESSDDAVGTVNESGTFTALKEGTVTLTASTGGASGSIQVTVEPSFSIPTRIELEPPTATVKPGDIQEFTAKVFDQHENEIDWVRIDWASSDMDKGSIDRAGLFAAFAEGTVDVIASAGSAIEMATVTITTSAGPEPTPTPGGGGGGGGGDSGDSRPTFYAGVRENLRAGETFTFMNIPISSVSSVAVTAAETIPRMMVTVKETSQPSAARPPAGDVYEYFEINLNWVNPQRISNATVVFTVPGAWLDEHDATAEDVRLMRYVDNTWQSLETTVIGNEGRNYHFRAIIPGFSTFAITAASASVTPIGETNATVGGETNATAGEELDVTPTEIVTEGATTEPTTVSVEAQVTPLIYAPLLAPLAFLLWARRRH